MKYLLGGGNTDLSTVATLQAPRPEYFAEDMVDYVLSILDETQTNGYKISGDSIDILSDGSDLGSTRARYSRLALQRQGAVTLWSLP